MLTMYVGFKLIGILGIAVCPIIFIVLKIFKKTGVLSDIWNFIMYGKTTNKTKCKSKQPIDMALEYSNYCCFMPFAWIHYKKGVSSCSTD